MAQTPIYGINQPTVSGDTGLWGGLLNTNATTLEDIIARPKIPHNSPTVAGTTTLDLSLSRAFKFTLSQASTLAITNVPANTFHVRLFVLVTNGSAFVLTYPASVTHVGGVAPVLQAAGVDLLVWETWDAGTIWYVRHAGKNLSVSGDLKSAIGASTSQAKPALVLYQTVSLSTTSVSDVSLASYSLPANALSVNGQSVRVSISGIETTQTGTIRIAFGATSWSLPVPIGSFDVRCLIVRLTATTQRASMVFVSADATTDQVRASPVETLSGAVLIDFRGNVVSGGTLTVDSITVEYLAA